MSKISLESSVTDNLWPVSGPFGVLQLRFTYTPVSELYISILCVFCLLEIRSELCNHDPPLGLGVDLGTGVVVADPTGICGTVSPTRGMGLNLVRLNPCLSDHLYFKV